MQTTKTDAFRLILCALALEIHARCTFRASPSSPKGLGATYASSLYPLTSADVHRLTLSKTGCQCVSPCKRSISQTSPWCHVEPSHCSASNTIYSGHVSPSPLHGDSLASEVERPENTISSGDASHSSALKARDILEAFIDAFIGVASANDRRLSELDECKCQSGVVGVWDFCDSNVLAAGDIMLESPQFNAPTPIEVQFDEADSDEDLRTIGEYNRIVKNETSAASQILPQFIHSTQNKDANFQLSSGQLSQRGRCHSSCKTCVWTAKALGSECLSCFESAHGPGLISGYFLAPLHFRGTGSNLQGRCVPMTKSRAFCHPSCKECRADCCEQSARSCVSCHDGSQFQPGPIKTIGQCNQLLSLSFQVSDLLNMPNDGRTQQLHKDWSDIFNSVEAEEVYLTAEESAAAKILPFLNESHRAVSSWLLHNSRPLVNRHNISTGDIVNHERTRKPPNNVSSIPLFTPFQNKQHFNLSANGENRTSYQRSADEETSDVFPPFQSKVSSLRQAAPLPPPRNSLKCRQIEAYLEKGNFGVSERERTELGPTTGQRYWTQLIFLHADNNILDAALQDLNEMRNPLNPSDFLNDMGEVFSNVADYMHLVVLIDTKRQSIEGMRQIETTDNTASGLFDVFGSPFSWLFGTSKADDFNNNNFSHSSIESSLSDNSDFYSYRQWKKVNEKKTARRKLSVSNQLGNVIICPNLSITDTTELDEFDPSNGEAFELYRIPKEGTRGQEYEWLLLRRRGEIDMNNPTILSEFISRSFALFPALHRALVLWDHGSAWAGFGDDDENKDNRNMPISDIIKGIKDGLRLYNSQVSSSSEMSKLSVVGFDACLMGEYNVVEAFSEYADYFIGSEDNEPGVGWNWRYLTPAVMEWTKGNGKISTRPATPFEYAQSILQGYANTGKRNLIQNSGLTMAIIETRAFIDFLKQFHLMLKTLHACGGRGINVAIQEMVSRSRSIQACELIGLCSCLDLGEFILGILEIVVSNNFEPSVVAQVVSVKSLFHRAVVLDLSTHAVDTATNDLVWVPTQFELLGLNTRWAPLNISRSIKGKLEPQRDPGGRRSGISIYFPLAQLKCPRDARSLDAQREYFRQFQTPWADFAHDVNQGKSGSICSSALTQYQGNSDAEQPILTSGVDPTEVWMIKSKQQIFRVSNAQIKKVNEHGVQLTATIPKSMVISKGIVGVSTHHKIPGLPESQLPRILLTGEVPIDQKKSADPSSYQYKLSSEWERRHYIASQRSEVSAEKILTSPLFVIAESQHHNDVQTDLVKKKSSNLSFITLIHFYESLAALRAHRSKTAHLFFGKSEPILYISDKDGLNRWPSSKGGYIRPVLRLLKNSIAFNEVESSLASIERLSENAFPKELTIDEVESELTFDWTAMSFEIKEVDLASWLKAFNIPPQSLPSKEVFGFWTRNVEDMQNIHLFSMPPPLSSNKSCDLIRQEFSGDGVCDHWNSECQLDTTKKQPHPGEEIDCQGLLPTQYKSVTKPSDVSMITTTRCGSMVCDPNADCFRNEIISSCVCRSGFDGPGTECHDIDECIGLPSPCDSSALCINTPGSFFCICPAGHIGNGTEKCHPSHQCQRKDEFGECLCSIGFQTKKQESFLDQFSSSGDSIECVDVDECALGLASCSPLAECTNLLGGYLCSCKSGHEGNGHICVKGRALIELTLIITDADSFSFLQNSAEQIVASSSSDSNNNNNNNNRMYNITKITELLIDGIAKAVEVSSSRIHIIGFGFPSHKKNENIIQMLLRFLPPEQSVNYPLVPEVSGYQMAIELQKQLSMTHSRIHDPYIVGQQFSRLSHKTFVEQYRILSASSLLPNFSLKSLWQTFKRKLPSIVQMNVPDELIALFCITFLLSCISLIFNFCSTMIRKRCQWKY